ncbi:MAG: hypothetical protein ABL869_12120 [Candidatus Nitrotoga sp.]
MMFLLWLTVVGVVAWSGYYAIIQEPSGLTIGMIGAVNGPVLTLLGYAMKLLHKD